MKSLQISAKCALAGTVTLLFCVPAAHAETYWAKGVSASGGWHDVAKTWGNDSYMCWAASASNILWWWQDKYVIPSDVPHGTDIWDYVKNRSFNDTGFQKAVYKMWFDGSDGYGGFYKNRTGFSLGPPDYKMEDLGVLGVSSYSPALVSTYVKTKFEDGWGLSIGIVAKETGYQHALTVWGAELTNGILSKIWITDSDDFYDGLVACAIEEKDNNFYLTPERYASDSRSFLSANQEYYIHLYVWLDSNADFLPMIPEPSAFGLLAGTLALVLAGTRRKRERREIKN